LALAKTEGTEGTEGVREDSGSDGIDGVSVRRAVGVAKVQPRGDSTLDDELPSVLRAVVRSAQRDEHVWIVIAAFRARNDVVEIEKNSVATSWNDAPPSVAPHDFATSCWRNVLVGARASTLATLFSHVGGLSGREADVLGIAGRHLDDGGVDLELLAPPLLPASVACAADGDSDLIAGSAFISGATEDVTRHEQQGGVFVDWCIGLSAQSSYGLAEGCEGLGSHLRAQDVSAKRWIAGVARLVAWLVTRDETFDLSESSTSRGFQPCELGLWRGNSG